MKNIGGRGHHQLSRLGTLENTSRIHFSFQPLARSPSHNPFLLITIHFHGGCTPLHPKPAAAGEEPPVRHLLSSSPEVTRTLESFDPARETHAFHQSRACPPWRGLTGSRATVSAPVPLRQKGHGDTMFLNVVFTPHWETSPLVPVSKSMSRADAGCGSAILPIPGQRSCHQAGRPGSRPAGCGSLRAGKAGSVRLGQHALLEP
jgi:hypothetical protein